MAGERVVAYGEYNIGGTGSHRRLKQGDILIDEAGNPVGSGGEPYVVEYGVFDETSKTINHNWNAYPLVTFIEPDGTESEPQIQHTSKNTVVITFGVVTSGTIMLQLKGVGSGVGNYQEVAVTGESSKTITHDYGQYPYVTYLETDGSVGYPSVQHLSKDQVLVDFGIAVTGTIVLQTEGGSG